MRRSQPGHADAVARRLAQLSAEQVSRAGVEEDEAAHTRIRGGDWTPARREAPPEPVVVRAPGRHARRRVWRPPVGWALPTLTRLHVAVVVGVCVLMVVIAVWAAGAKRAEQVPVAHEEPVVDASALVDVASAPAPAQESSASALTELTVDVAGKVARPGIVVLAPGSRVVDAIEAAGGARRGVDLSGLNQARMLVDGEQILVGVAPRGGAVGGAPPAPSGATLVNINSADQTTLETLPGVGPVTATSIIDWRTSNGGFSAITELLEVDGIGDATLAKLTPLVTI